MLWSETEAAHRAASDAQRVVWVDEQDRVLGAVSRADLRQRRLIGRCTYILLFNPAGELCIHRRTLSKALYPGYWDVAAGGMVDEGESYLQSARRELAEELGIEDASLEDCGRFFYDAPESRLWCGVFRAQSSAPLRLQPEEVLEARFVSLEHLHGELARQQWCPDSQKALEHYLAKRV